MNRRGFLILSLGAGALLLTGHTPYRQWYVYRKKRLIIVASEAEEASLRLGEMIAHTLATHLPESKAMMATTASSVDIVKLLKSEQLDVAVLPSDEAYQALRGTGRFSGWAVPLRTLAVFEPSLLHLVTLAGNGIRGVPDLKGKTVGMGIPGSQTEAMFLRVLEASGIDPERDLRRESLPLAEAIAALKEKKVDAFAWVAPVPIAALRDLAGTPALAITLLDQSDALPRIQATDGPIYHLRRIPRGTYRGVVGDVGVAAIAPLLVCRDDLSNEKAYQISKTLAEHGNAVTLAGFNLRASPGPPDGSPLAFHPGALQFYQGRAFPLGGERGR